MNPSENPRRFSALADILSRILPLRDLDRLLGAVCQAVVDILAADRCLIIETAGKPERWRVRAACPGTDPSVETHSPRYSRRHVLQAVTERRTLVFERLDSPVSEVAARRVGDVELRSALCTPLVLPRDGGIFGVIYADSRARRRRFTTEDMEIMDSFAGLASIAVENAHLFTRATMDDLTGVYARDFLLRRLGEEFHRSRRNGRPLAVIMCDLDGFKEVNDRFGHMTGDRVLQRFAEVMRRQIREYDFLGRYGGDEFTLVMPGAGFYHAYRRAREIRRSVARVLAEECPGMPGVSMGGAVYPFVSVETPEELLQTADGALYRAKRQGRDRVLFYGQEELLRWYERQRDRADGIRDFEQFMRRAERLPIRAPREQVWVMLAELLQLGQRFRERMREFQDSVRNTGGLLEHLDPPELQELYLQTRKLFIESRHILRILESLGENITPGQLADLAAAFASARTLQPPPRGWERAH